MPTIKIVPMPGVAVPGPSGPRGYQGDQGIPGPAGADANTGDIVFSGNDITAHGDITIGVDVVPGVINLSAYAGVNVQTSQDFGLYVNGIEPNNKVLTAGDLVSINLFPEPVNWNPSISATNFLQTSNTATGQYFKYGKMVVVDMIMNFSNVTNFGVGQYSVNLPFPAAKHGSVFGGTLHSESNGYYSIKGHFNSNDSSMTLWYVSVVGKDAEFDNNSPVLLTTADAIHMNFIYETTA